MNTTLFGSVPTMLALGLAVLTGGVLLIVVGLGVSNPVLVRMGRRNMVRRPSQTLILLGGLVLSTVFITASFGLSDSFIDSTAAYRLAQVGNVDEAVTGSFTQNQITQSLSRIRQLPEVQVATGIDILRSGTQITSARTGLTISGVDVYAVPPEFDQVFGSVTGSHGQPLHFANLHPNEVFLSTTLAQNFDAHTGDTLILHLESGNQTLTVTVRAILSTDVVVTSGELSFAGAYNEIIMPLASFQQVFERQFHQSLPVNTICIKNVGQGGLDDIGPGGSRSQVVTSFLEQFFRAHPDAHGSIPTDFAETIVHPLKPDTVEALGLGPITTKNALISSPAARQFYYLLPVFTCLLVGAGMLLLVLLCLLLAAERRAELGMSRAIGLQRYHLVQALLMEGCGYGAVAALLGVPLGVGAIALELAALTRLPLIASQPGAPVEDTHITLHVWVSWQSLLSAWCLGVLTTVVVVVVTAIWISRTNIVAAMRDLDSPPPMRVRLLNLLRAFWTRPQDAAGQPIPETSARRLSRQSEAVSSLLWELFVRGPLCLLLGAVLVEQANTLGDDWIWMRLLGIVLLIAGVGLLAGWFMPMLKVPLKLSRRLCFSIIGIGWLVYSLQSRDIFYLIFALHPNNSRDPSTFEILLDMLLPLVGVVVLVMTNIDVVVELLTKLTRRIPGLAPISRTSLVYPLTFRFRTGVTVVLLGIITFLIMLLVTNNLSAIQQTQVQVTTGNFQIEMEVSENDNRALARQIQATPTTLRQDVAAVALMRFLYEPSDTPMRLLLPGQPSYYASGGPRVVDDTFLSSSTIPMFARAQGFTSDRQVWDAVRDHPGYAVMQYTNSITELPASNGFAPFAAEVPDRGDHPIHYHRVTIIGLVSSNTRWQTLFLSSRTAAGIVPHPFMGFNFYYFQLQPGVSIVQASSDLSHALHAWNYGIQLTSLEAADRNAYTANMTLFLGVYLILGLLFGALSIGVIASRAVVERRQQIGMLRALGFSRVLVRRSFLLESSFVITLSLLTGTALAWLLAYQVALTGNLDFPIPVGPVVLILLGSYLVAFVSTILPARRASHLPPAEALRYE